MYGVGLEREYRKQTMPAGLAASAWISSSIAGSVSLRAIG